MFGSRWLPEAECDGPGVGEGVTEQVAQGDYLGEFFEVQEETDQTDGDTGDPDAFYRHVATRVDVLEDLEEESVLGESVQHSRLRHEHGEGAGGDTEEGREVYYETHPFRVHILES